jgi:hypothetical protein
VSPVFLGVSPDSFVDGFIRSFFLLMLRISTIGSALAILTKTLPVSPRPVVCIDWSEPTFTETFDDTISVAKSAAPSLDVMGLTKDNCTPALDVTNRFFL